MTGHEKAPSDVPDEAMMHGMHKDLITAHLLPPCGGTGFGTYRTDHRTMVAKASQGQSLHLSG